MTFSIYDVSDALWDSGVFIQGGTFSNIETPYDDVPEPVTLALMGMGFLGFGFGRRKAK